MGLKSGMMAAAKGGVPVAAVQVGPRRGKFYFSPTSGNKVYGEPPRGHLAATPPPHVPDRPNPVSPGGVSPKKTMKELYAKGEVVHVEVADGKWEKGTVYKTFKNHAQVELHNGTWVESYPDSTRKIGVAPAAAPPAHGPPHPPKPAAMDLLKYAASVNGSPEFKRDVEHAILKSGLAPFLEKHPLREITEKTSIPGATGLYRPAPFVLFTEVHAPGETPKAQVFIRNEAGLASSSESAVKAPRVGYPHAATVSFGDTVSTFRQSVLIHELSHHLQLHSEVKSGNPKHPLKAAPYAEEWTHRAWAHVKEVRETKAWAPSHYARTSTTEWFAEAHTAYTLHREVFQKNDPAGFALVKERRKMEGLHD